jgi:transcriptional regulator with XRE-family HTH domain
MAADNSALLLSFGRVLRQARTGCGLTQEKLALDSGLDRTFIWLLERGLRQPSLMTLVQLADSLGAEAAGLVRAAVAGTRRKR